jgi:hypothetical protein
VKCQAQHHARLDGKLRACDFFVFAQKSVLKTNSLCAQKPRKLKKVTNSQSSWTARQELFDVPPANHPQLLESTIRSNCLDAEALHRTPPNSLP